MYRDHSKTAPVSVRENFTDNHTAPTRGRIPPALRRIAATLARVDFQRLYAAATLVFASVYPVLMAIQFHDDWQASPFHAGMSGACLLASIGYLYMVAALPAASLLRLFYVLAGLALPLFC